MDVWGVQCGRCVMAISACLCCNTACAGCPGGLALSYTISMPTAVTPGSCLTPDSCSSSSSSVSVTFAGCAGTLAFGCAAGYSMGAGFTPAVTLSADDFPFINCTGWSVYTQFVGGFGPGSRVCLRYQKAWDSGNPIGTYSLTEIKSNCSGITVCVGATADATITVSP